MLANNLWTFIIIAESILYNLWGTIYISQLRFMSQQLLEIGYRIIYFCVKPTFALIASFLIFFLMFSRQLVRRNNMPVMDSSPE